MSEDSPKRCTDCKHVIPYMGAGGREKWTYAMCGHPKGRQIADGAPELIIHHMRSKSGYWLDDREQCGPAALWFEEKPPKPPSWIQRVVRRFA